MVTEGTRGEIFRVSSHPQVNGKAGRRRSENLKGAPIAWTPLRKTLNIHVLLTQFNIDEYKIELYFPKHKLVVKCDEFDHKDRNIEYEVRRQNYTENKLGCQFIQFNPDGRGFNIFEVVNRFFSCISKLTSPNTLKY